MLTDKDIQRISDEFVAMRPPGGFKTGLIDCPWLFKHRSEAGEKKAAQNHYDCLPMEDIRRLPLRLLFADDVALFSWMTWPTMMDWPDIVRAWGFDYAGLAWEWLKYNPKTQKYAFGPGYGTRKNVEPCILITRGNPSLRDTIEGDLFGDMVVPEGVRSVRDFIQAMPLDAIRSPRREHSEKPDEQYARIETMFDGPYVELFSRKDRPNWKSWGNQTGLLNVA